jgi:DNA-binding GntR family transcriptional regulator
MVRFPLHKEVEEMRLERVPTEMARYFGVPVPEIVYSGKEEIFDKEGRPISGEYCATPPDHDFPPGSNRL